ncbi:MAG: bifunctional folylpolyglutamate synthase/dihydrofolate synthase [Verrucomicrobia bacterium]|nr:bifunctional folylpolyglutamate synthase/dihydrofolate synthase [Verrucomicrobiota bacterium]
MSASSHPELDWLYTTQMFGIKLGLDNVTKLLGALGLPGQGMRFIHVAGTNGKGSTCAFIHAMMQTAGVSAGLFTSPHLVRFNERIRDHEREISDAEIEVGLAKLRVLVADWETHPTFFELTFALALDWFQQRGLPWAILETGMGGRLDATNAITPEVSVITRIGFDHMEQLGDTLAKIAGEKAGIIKPGVTVVTGLQDPLALNVIKAVAKEKKSYLSIVDGPLMDVELGLEGPHQAWNAALALEAVREAGIKLPAVQLEIALKAVQWRGRFQSLCGGRLILDGAHNPEAAFVLATTWEMQFPDQSVEIIFAAAKDKDIAGVMSALSPIVKAWHFTTFHSPRAMPTAQLREIWDSLDIAILPITEHADLSSALRAAGESKRLIAGSLYLVGEALALLEGSPEEFQASLQ